MGLKIELTENHMPKAESKGACLVVGAGDGVGGAIAKAFALPIEQLFFEDN